jgi:serine protease
VWSRYIAARSTSFNVVRVRSVTGTSTAAPHAAAVAALVVASGVATTPSDVYTRLELSADDLGTPGFDPIYGFGRVNACCAVGVCG